MAFRQYLFLFLSGLGPVFLIGLLLHDQLTHSVLVDRKRDQTASNTSTPSSALPYNGGLAELPSPWLNTTLVHIALGVGRQNYSCKYTNDTPTSTGAIATLFDITAVAKSHSDLTNSLPALAADFYAALGAGEIRNQFANLIIGEHYFNFNGYPTFNLSSAGQTFVGKKTADVSAPPQSDRGPYRTGAVDWLQLSTNGRRGIGRLSQVYRVVTAGGAPFTLCSAAGIMEIPYAAQYWFYG